MLTPGLTDLFEPLSVVSAATHTVNILRNKRMVIARQSKPIHVDCAFVAGISSQRDPNAAIDCTITQLHQADQLAYDDIRARNSPDAGLIECWQRCGFHITVFVKPCYLDRLHGRADRDFARNGACI
jgi:hypothetical protein